MFDEMTGIRSVIRMLLYVAWGVLLAMKIRREKVRGIEYISLAVAGIISLNLLIPIWEFQRVIYVFVTTIPGLYSVIFLLTGILAGYIGLPAKNAEETGNR